MALLVCVAVGLVGCGGKESNTNNSTTSMIPEEYMTALGAAIQTRNVDAIRNRISNDYSDDCETKEEFVARIMGVLGNAGAIDFDILPITNKSVDELRNKGEFDGGFVLTVTEGETTRSLQESGRMFIRRDNSPWQLYGDHECIR
jgi:hypothetical protein